MFLYQQIKLQTMSRSYVNGITSKLKIKELGLDNCSTPTGNSAYTSCQMSFEDIVNTHHTFMKPLGIELSDDDKKLPYLY